MAVATKKESYVYGLLHRRNAALSFVFWCAAIVLGVFLYDNAIGIFAWLGVSGAVGILLFIPMMKKLEEFGFEDGTIWMKNAFGLYDYYALHTLEYQHNANGDIVFSHPKRGKKRYQSYFQCERPS